MNDDRVVIKGLRSGSDNQSFHSPKHLWAWAFILMATIFCYMPVFDNGFVNWDDDKYIYDNPLIRELNFKAFFSQYVMGHYHPFVITAYALIYKIFGLQPDAYHGANLLFHLANTSLVFFLFIALTESLEIAFIVSLLFGIHPMHVESVAWASELKDVMYAFFFLLAWWYYVRYIKHGFLKKHYLLALLFFVCSVLSKAMGVSLVVVLLLTDFLWKRPIQMKLWTEKIPFILFSLGVGVVAIIAQRDAGAMQDIPHFHGLHRLLFASSSFITYVFQLLAPYDLSPYYPYPITVAERLPWQYYLYPFLCLLLAAATFYSLKFTRWLFFSIGFFTATIFLVLQWLPVGEVIMADRYSYIPSIAIFYLIALGILQLKKVYSGKILPVIILSVLMLVNFFMTLKQVAVWKDDLTFWSCVIEKSPRESLAYNNRGVAKNNLQDYSGAVNDFDIAIQISPQKPEPFNGRGIAKYRLQKFPEAIADFSRAIAISPSYVDAYFHRGNSKAALGEYKAAAEDYTRAIEWQPDYAEAFYNRGNTQTELKNLQAAFHDYSTAIKWQPDYADAYYNRAIIQIMSGDTSAACADLSTASTLGYSAANELLSRFCRL